MTTTTTREMVKDNQGNMYDFEDCMLYADRVITEELNAELWESNQDYFVAYMTAHCEKYNETTPFSELIEK